MMQILGSIQSENVAVTDRDRMQRLMRDFIGELRPHCSEAEISYKIHFWRPFFGAKVDALIEFRLGREDAWYARANGADPWRSFCRALNSLKQLVVEMELRGDETNGSVNGRTPA